MTLNIIEYIDTCVQSQCDTVESLIARAPILYLQLLIEFTSKFFFSDWLGRNVCYRHSYMVLDDHWICGRPESKIRLITQFIDS